MEFQVKEGKSAVVQAPVLSKHGASTRGRTPCHPGRWLVPEPPTAGHEGKSTEVAGVPGLSCSCYVMVDMSLTPVYLFC